MLIDAMFDMGNLFKSVLALNSTDQDTERGSMNCCGLGTSGNTWRKRAVQEVRPPFHTLPSLHSGEKLPTGKRTDRDSTRADQPSTLFPPSDWMSNKHQLKRVIRNM